MRQCMRHARLRGCPETTQVDRLKRRARVERMPHLHHVPERDHTVHAGEHRAPAEPEVRARFSSFERLPPPCVCTDRRLRLKDNCRCRTVRPLAVRSCLWPGRPACLPRCISTPKRLRRSPARTRSRRSSGGYTSRAMSALSSCCCLEAHSAEALQPPSAHEYLHGVRYARKAVEACHLGE